MNFTTKHCAYKTIPQEEFNGLLSLRYEVFKKRMGWEVETQGTLEQDDYDDEHAGYLYVKDSSEQVVGCCRLIPTTGRYMLKDTFQILLGGATAPVGKKIVEISRLGVKKSSSLIGASISEVTLKLLQSIYIHGVENDIEEYIVVTSTSIERLMRYAGIPCQRIGDKQVHMLGETRSITLSIPVNSVFRNAVLN